MSWLPLLLVSTALASPGGDDWPAWRGPARDGVSKESGWLQEGRPLWEAEVGRGHSSPVVVADRLYIQGFYEALTGGGQGEDRIVCLNAETGDPIWSVSFEGLLRAHGHSGGTLTTPAVSADGESLFVTNREGTVRCLQTSDGSVRWERDVAADSRTKPNDYGFGGSPLLVDGRLYVNVGKTVALDAQTGETVWTTDNIRAMYSTPATFQLGDQPCVAVFSKKGLFVLDRETGTELHSFPWEKGKVAVNASTPVVIGQELFISSAYNHGSALVRFDNGKAEARWESKVMRTKLSGCILYDGHLFGFDESRFKCIDLSGRELWRKRGLGMGAFTISDGRLILLSEKGDLVVAEASGKKYRELSRTRIFKRGSCWTSPVLAGGRLYLRNSLGDLVCRDHRPE